MFLSIVAYLSIFLFIGISAYKAYEFARMPLHGRMELYPVPKEKGHEHGGSYYEEVGWWQKPREISHITEIKEMLKEMLFIKKLFENQKPLWWISYSLHLGIYLLAGWTILLVFGAITELSGITVSPESGLWGSLLYYLTVLTGVAGLILAAFGSGMLFLRRLFDETLKKYTTPQEYFNLLLIYAAVVTGILAWVTDLTFNSTRQVMMNILTFTPFAAGTIMTLHVILLGIMFIYIPLSKMSHYIGKYFTFHKVLWENDPNLPGSEIEQKVKEAASYRPKTSWSAPHINPVPAPTKEQ